LHSRKVGGNLKSYGEGGGGTCKRGDEEVLYKVVSRGLSTFKAVRSQEGKKFLNWDQNEGA